MGKGDTTAVLAAAGGTTLTAAGLMVGAEASAVALPTAVAGLLGAAGVSASVPVVGWVIAGLLGATAGSIALVRIIRTNKTNKAEAQLKARGLGLESADEIGGYVVKAIRKGKQWRADEAASLIKKIQKNPDRKGKTRKRDAEKLRFLVIADLDQQAADRGKAPKTAPIAELQKSIGDADSGITAILVGVVLGGAALLLSRIL